MSLLQLIEIASYQEHSTVVSQAELKRAKNQFNNANYILQCTRNRSRLCLPLIMVTHYKGLQVLAKADVHTSPEYSAAVSTLQQETAQLEQETSISRSLFEDP